MESGVYRILNLVNKKCDVGSTVDFKKRWRDHKRLLRSDRFRHHSPHLQYAWNKYGEEGFVFEILEFCEPTKEKLLQLEQIWMDSLCSYLPEYGYNICRVAGSCLGVKLSEEHKRKISEANLGKKLSEETKRKISKAAQGRKLSEEQKKKLLAANLGKKMSEGTKRKISKASRGRRHTEEAKKKMSEARRGKKLTEEQKKKLLEANLGRKLSEEHKRKISEANLGRKQSEETKEKRLGRKHSEESKRKMSEAKSRATGLSPNIKITSSEAQQIVLKYATGKYKQVDLAREYKVDASTIWYILKTMDKS